MENVIITGDTLVWIAGVLAAVISIIVFIKKVVLWVNKQEDQDKRISELEQKHKDDIKDVNEDLTALTYGVLALLRAEQGDKSNIQDARDQLEKNLNRKAHQ